MIIEIKIPDISENVETGLIAGILVSEGDKVTAGQALVEVETDKASTEIPSGYDGVVKEIKVKDGDEIKVNQVIILLEVQDDKDENKEEVKAEETDEPTSQKDTDTDEKEEAGAENNKEQKDDKTKPSKDKPGDNNQIPVSPLARKVAREHDVDLADIKGSGTGNRISRADVEEFVHSGDKAAKDKQTVSGTKTDTANTTKEPLNNIGRITAQTMQEAWQTIPHVTQFDEADITNLEKFRQENQEKIQRQGGKLTVTSILLKVSAYALKKFPRFNASLDWENKDILFNHDYNIGVAVDTPQGLLVPVIRNANRKSLADLSAELSELSKKARNKKLASEEMQGGTFTYFQPWRIGGTGFAPIVYPPQVAILGISRAKHQQVQINEELEKRLVMPLSLSYDHRVINGADGARFLRWVCNVLEDPYAFIVLIFFKKIRTETCK
ncbi:MAG: 2-oxo acid dehydrogenase subunit E2 [Bacteroidales bacterium]|nr:2-oxo acid dehydrogenase subunit E2 [Bacteroidales bacterium]